MFKEKVNVLIIGAGKSGTMTLWHYLKQHKDVCFSDVKEVGYFTREDLFKRGQEYYHDFFRHYNNEKIWYYITGNFILYKLWK